MLLLSPLHHNMENQHAAVFFQKHEQKSIIRKSRGCTRIHMISGHDCVVEATTITNLDDQAAS